MKKENLKTLNKVSKHVGANKLPLKIKEFIKNDERGSVTLFTLATCMFIVMILVLVNISFMNNNMNQEKELIQIIKNYDIDNDDLENAYQKVVSDTRLN
jgi:hypothetical protein